VQVRRQDLHAQEGRTQARRTEEGRTEEGERLRPVEATVGRGHQEGDCTGQEAGTISIEPVRQGLQLHRQVGVIMLKTLIIIAIIAIVIYVMYVLLTRNRT
jgi:hypothetical protein